MGPPDFFLFHLPGPFAPTLSPLVAGNESERNTRKITWSTLDEVATHLAKAWFSYEAPAPRCSAAQAQLITGPAYIELQIISLVMIVRIGMYRAADMPLATRVRDDQTMMQGCSKP